MIAAKEFTKEQIQRAYNRRSWLYSKTVAEMEREYHKTAIDMARIQPGEKVLEVAVGPGITFLQLASLAGKDHPVYGVDLSASMLEMARRRLVLSGFQNVVLKEADSRSLPFDDNSFDLLYNAYMLDLIPERDMAGILTEFKRVLRPGGRLVLLNMSKQDGRVTPRERLYQRMPRMLALYLMGACRPVLMEGPTQAAGFEGVSRLFLGGKAPSEIVMGLKPLYSGQTG